MLGRTRQWHAKEISCAIVVFLRRINFFGPERKIRNPVNLQGVVILRTEGEVCKLVSYRYHAKRPKFPGGVLPGHLGGGVRPAAGNPNPISDQNM